MAAKPARRVSPAPAGGTSHDSRGKPPTGIEATGQLDRVIHERIRLGIVSALAVNETLSFNDLKNLLKTSDGNVSVHARKLEEADYVASRKFFEGRIPRTEYRLTAGGRKALERYLRHMESVIRAARGG